MGVFDLRCGLSGLSTRAYSGSKPDTCSMVLLEELEGLWVPVFFPVSGSYDQYGRIELRASHAEAEHAEWVGCLLELMADSGALHSSYPKGLAYASNLGGPAATVLGHAADSVFNAFSVTLDEHRVIPCLFRDDIARAVAASPSMDPSAEEKRLLGGLARAGGPETYANWLAQHDRPIQASFVRQQHRRAALGLLDDPPPMTHVVAERFRRVMRHAETRGGLRPIAATDAWQHDSEALDRFAQEAWDSRDPILRSVLREWQRRNEAARELALPFHLTPRERALSALGVTLDTVASVLRANYDGEIATRLIAAVERAPVRDTILNILRAAPPNDAAVLSEFDGQVAFRAGRLFVESEHTPGLAFEVDTRGRSVIVTAGARVAAGDPLTEGDPTDMRQIVRIFGGRFAMDRLALTLRPLLELDDTEIHQLAAPMVSHVSIEQTRQRVTGEQWDRWCEAGVIESHRLHAREEVTSYAVLAAHRDPTLEEVLAEAARREAVPCDSAYDFEYRMKIHLDE